jgi:Tol biopolymer transport system component
VASLASPHREPEVLVSNPEGALQPYRWTRDGKSVVYWRADEWSASLWCDGVALHSVSAAGGPARFLGVSVLAHEDVLDLAPKSAGNRIAVTSGEGRETWAEKQIALIDLESGLRRNLTGEDIAANCPAWSPDGRRIAYVAGPDAAVVARKSNRLPPAGGEEAHAALQKRKIWELDSNGASEPRQLTGDSRYRDEEPTWSADGSHLLFGRMDYDGRASLWMMEGHGGAAKQVCGLKIFDPFIEEDNWFGFYGYIDWHDAFDWRRPEVHEGRLIDLEGN